LSIHCFSFFLSLLQILILIIFFDSSSIVSIHVL
jgi:hypothetical protein